MTTSTKKTTIQLRIAQELKDKIKVEADRQGRSTSNLIRWIVERFINEKTGAAV